MELPEMEPKNRKKFLVLNIIPFELRTRNSHNLEQDISHWQSICYETPLRFNISLREIISESGSPIVMKKYDENGHMQILHEPETI